MTAKMTVREQLLEHIRSGWELKDLEKLHLAELTFGHYKAHFVNTDLDIEAKLYLTMDKHGWINNLFRLPDMLKEAERGKCEQFSEAL